MSVDVNSELITDYILPPSNRLSILLVCLDFLLRLSDIEITFSLNSLIVLFGSHDIVLVLHSFHEFPHLENENLYSITRS